MTRLFAAALAALSLAAPAQASPVSVFSENADGLTFERHRSGGGAHGVEFKSNKVLIGTDTQRGKTHNRSKGNLAWDDTAAHFTFVYADGLSEISVWGDDFAKSVSYSNIFVANSNALIFEANGRPNLTLTGLDGHDLDIDIGAAGGDTWSDWEKVVFVSEDISDGFTLDGRINMSKRGPSTINFDLGRATAYVASDAGDPVASVPVPAPLPLLLASLGGLLMLRRHRAR